MAERKIRQLLKFQCQLTVISPEASKFINTSARQGKIKWMKRPYISPEAVEYSMVIAATDDMEMNRLVFNDAASNNIPVNVVDIPELCTVYFPSIIERGNITIAIGSDGKAPFFTRTVRESLEINIPDSLAKISLLAEKFREFMKEKCAGNFNLKNKMCQRFLKSVENEPERWSVENPPFDEWSEWLNE